MLFRSRSLILGAFVCATIVAIPYVASSSASADETCDAECRQTLATIRSATARYQRESVAINAGYEADPVCVASPAGAMGTHYVNHELTSDIDVDAAAPEILLYTELPNGQRKLAGVEFLVPVIVDGQPWFGTDPPPAGQFNEAPQLAGQTFAGPMPGHNPFMPWHYDLHVWVWHHNPAGIFAQWNPSIACPE